MKEYKNFETELYELKMPGALMGKEVVDSKAKRVGIVRNIKLNFESFNIILIVKGLGIEFPIKINDVDKIGTIIRLKIPLDNSEELDIEQVIKIREDISSEIKILFSNFNS